MSKEKKITIKGFKELLDNDKWNKSKLLKNVIWCCEECGDIVDGGKLPRMAFMGSIHCGNCDSLLTERTPGNQSSSFNWIPKLQLNQPKTK